MLTEGSASQATIAFAKAEMPPGHPTPCSLVAHAGRISRQNRMARPMRRSLRRCALVVRATLAGRRTARLDPLGDIFHRPKGLRDASGHRWRDCVDMMSIDPLPP